MRTLWAKRVEEEEDEVDPRELTEGFQRMPPDAQEEIRAEWRKKDQFEERLDEMRQTTFRRTIVEGILLMLAAQVLLSYASWGRTACAVPVGALVGWAWYLTRARRFRCMAIGTAGHLLMGYWFGFGDIVTMFFGILAVMGLSVAIGVGHESRRADGTDIY